MEDSYVLQLQEPKFREFYLSYSGYAQCGPLHCYGPASRPHYLIHFVVKGKGMYQASGQKHYLTAGQGFLIEPGTQTFYQADKDDPWSYLWIGVGGTNAGKYIRDIGLNSEQLIFRSESGEELKKIVLDILKHTESTTSNLYYLQGRLYDFFSVLTKDVVIDTYLGNTKEKKYGRENGYGEYIKEAMAFIKNEYACGIGVQELAEHLNVNRSYLYTNKESISLGLVATISLAADGSRNEVPVYQMLEDFKNHPAVAPIVRGAKMVEHSGHMVPEGGYDMIPKYVFDGCLLAGEAAGLCMNMGYQVRGMDFAVASGQMAAKAAVEALDKGDVSEAGLSSYREMMGASFVIRDLRTFSKWPHVMEGWG